MRIEAGTHRTLKLRKLYMGQALLLTLALQLTPQRAHASAEERSRCTQIFQGFQELFEFNETPAPKSAVAPWSMERRDLKLRAEHLLPAGFIGEVEAALGPIRIEVQRAKDEVGAPPFLRIFARTGLQSRYFILATLTQDATDPQALVIDELILENPLETDTPLAGHLRASQDRKGLPYPVFKHLRESLTQIARAGGFHRFKCKSQQNYAVLMLYSKMVGMEPADPASRELVEFLERSYRYAKRQLPEHLRARSLDDFVRMTGNLMELSTPALMMGEQWQTMVEDGALPEGAVPYLDDSGNFIGAELPAPVGMSVFAFADPYSPVRGLLEWRKFVEDHPITLVSRDF